uniref:Uncharacterized protein n=1 Tax=Anopheles merus TaxID=30066 RepID=A0A182UYR6_ANOME
MNGTLNCHGAYAVVVVKVLVLVGQLLAQMLSGGSDGMSETMRRAWMFDFHVQTLVIVRKGRLALLSLLARMFLMGTDIVRRLHYVLLVRQEELRLLMMLWSWCRVLWNMVILLVDFLRCRIVLATDFQRPSVEAAPDQTKATIAGRPGTN